MTQTMTQQRRTPSPAPMYRFVAPNNKAKKRSSQACLECRRRKVRCDIVKQKPRFCTNCRLDGVVCEVDRQKCRRCPQLLLSSCECGFLPASRGSVIAEEHAPLTPKSPDVSYGDLMRSDLGGNDDEPRVPMEEREDSAQSHNHRTMSPAFAFNTPPQPDLSCPSISMASFLRSAALPGTGEDILLPPFIEPLPTRLRKEDWQYLSAKDCFSFPPLALERVILQRFVDYIYPLLPVVDIEQVIAAITDQSQSQVSLLVYHALMSAGLAAVEDGVLVQYDYQSKAAARNVFYTKTKALLDVGIETDRQVICQATLLLVGWSRNNDPIDGYYWSGIAITYGCSLRLDKLALNPRVDGACWRLKSRIWWTILMQESDVCLAIGKPPRLTFQDVPKIQLYDVVNEASIDATDLAEVERTKTRHILQSACIEKAKLCLINLRLLRFLHTVDEARSKPPFQDAKVWHFDAELQDWKHQLPDGLWYLGRSYTSTDKKVQLTVSMTNLIFLLAKIVLHKPQVPVRLWADSSRGNANWSAVDDNVHPHQAHAKAMRRAADDMASIYKDLARSGLTQVIPGMGIPTICAAAGVHLLDARSNQGSLRESSFEKLEVLLSVLRDVGKLNPTAEEVAKLVESSVEAARSGFHGAHDRAGREGAGTSAMLSQSESPSHSHAQGQQGHGHQGPGQQVQRQQAQQVHPRAGTLSLAQAGDEASASPGLLDPLLQDVMGTALDPFLQPQDLFDFSFSMDQYLFFE